MEEVEKVTEALLFMSGRPVSIYDLLKATGSDLRTIKSAIKNIQSEYGQRGSWLEIVHTDNSYLLRLKPEQTDKVSNFVQETELSKRALRVLAVIAQKDGILQSKVVRMLGTTVYDGVQELTEKGYLVVDVKGHSKALRLSHKFKQYFGEIPVGKKEGSENVENAGSPAEAPQSEQTGQQPSEPSE